MSRPIAGPWSSHAMYNTVSRAAVTAPPARRVEYSTAARGAMPKRRKNRNAWARLSEERLLDVRLCDLGLRIEGSWLEECIEQLYDELAAKDRKSVV